MAPRNSNSLNAVLLTLAAASAPSANGLSYNTALENDALSLYSPSKAEQTEQVDEWTEVGPRRPKGNGKSRKIEKVSRETTPTTVAAPRKTKLDGVTRGDWAAAVRKPPSPQLAAADPQEPEPTVNRQPRLRLTPSAKTVRQEPHLAKGPGWCPSFSARSAWEGSRAPIVPVKSIETELVPAVAELFSAFSKITSENAAEAVEVELPVEEAAEVEAPVEALVEGPPLPEVAVVEAAEEAVVEEETDEEELESVTITKPKRRVSWSDEEPDSPLEQVKTIENCLNSWRWSKCTDLSTEEGKTSMFAGAVCYAMVAVGLFSSSYLSAF